MLEFNSRVLAEGMDETNPLLERLKFLGIVSSNMDEFFMVRIASYPPDDPELAQTLLRAKELMKRQENYFLQKMAPEMESAGLVRLMPEALTPVQMERLKTFYDRELFPVLTPISLAADGPVPVLSNLRLHLLFTLTDGKTSEPKYAVVEIPSNFPRMVYLPSEKGHPFVLLEDVVSFFARDLFSGFEIIDRGLIRLTRGAEMTLDEEKDEDFMKVMTEALRRRREGAIMRLEIRASAAAVRFICERFSITEASIVPVSDWFDLKSVSQIALQPGFEQLKRKTWEPRPCRDFEESDDVWALLKSKNVLAVFPYESFDCVSRFLQTAAEDPDVLAIKQTLYRIDKDSPILRSLETAAEKGKRVTALIELKARFDEANNIEWARRLQMAGATVLYGLAGLKTHAKACLVIRRESEGIKRYVHLSTGNYNEKTARLYSDFSYFTTNEDLANDISAFFNMITGYSQPAGWAKIDVAPYGLRRKLLRLIRREILVSTPQKPGLIMAKMNSLCDPEIIEALYQASKAGVRIRLNVRGICTLKPGLKGLSETIEVISIVDQFLEHGRLFYFANGGNDEFYMASADWMPRNLDRRIELMVPVEDPETKKRLMEILNLYFRDNVKSWHLIPDGTYIKIEAGARKKVRAQETLCDRVIEEEKNIVKSIPRTLKPQKPLTSLQHQ